MRNYRINFVSLKSGGMCVYVWAVDRHGSRHRAEQVGFYNLTPEQAGGGLPTALAGLLEQQELPFLARYQPPPT